jgi:hypothetical protein
MSSSSSDPSVPAGTWERTSQNLKSSGYTTLEYFQEAMQYTVTYTYHVTGIRVDDIPLTMPSASTYSNSIVITHYGVDIDGTTYTQNVYCYVAEKPSVLTSPTEDGVIEVKIVYKGRVCGFHKIIPGKIDRTVNQFWDLLESTDDAVGTITGSASGKYHEGIGIDFAGTPIHAPVFTLGLLVVVPTDELGAVLNSIEEVSAYGGTANEEGWFPPWVSTLAPHATGGWPEAQQLCVGYSNVNSDNVTRTTEFSIDFEYDSLRQSGQHLYTWRKANDVPVGVDLLRTYEPDLITSQVNELAGDTNRHTGVGTNPLFYTNINWCYDFRSLGGNNGIAGYTTQALLLQ